MNKYVTVGIIVIAIVFVEILIQVSNPVISEFANTANMTMAVSSNMTNYPGTSAALVSVPWVLYFVPPIIGIIAIVLVLKAP